MKTFYRLLDISPKSSWLLLYGIPPISFLYFIAVGNYLLEKTGKRNQLFQFFTITFSGIFCYLILTGMFFPAKFKVLPEAIKAIIIITGVISYFMVIVILSFITVKYERSLQAERHFTFADNMQYLGRYFTFALFPYTIYGFHLLVYEYRKNEY